MTTNQPRDYHWVLVVSGDDQSEPHSHYLDAGEHVVGSGSDADVVIPAKWVSRAHARLTVREDGTVVVEDLGSLNGTRLNGHAITHAEVTRSCMLVLGSVRVELHPLDAAAGSLALHLHLPAANGAGRPQRRCDRPTEEHLAVERPLAASADPGRGALALSGA